MKVFDIGGRYGSFNINGKDMKIDKMNVDELNEYLDKFENNRMELIKEQNDYLSMLISQKLDLCEKF